MIALLQRVVRADVQVQGRTVAAIGQGILTLVCVEKADDDAVLRRMLDRVLGYRIFADAQGRMNLSVCDVGGGLLLVPQFTLAADTRKGMRPSFTSAAPPEFGRIQFEKFLALAASRYPYVASGEFGADMQVSLVNDGPVTFWLQSAKPQH